MFAPMGRRNKKLQKKLKTRELNQINISLSRIKSEMPTEIHRAVRDLSTLHFWKGTEFRTFHLYLGIVALKDIVPANEYNHFLQLSCAVILCSSNDNEKQDRSGSFRSALRSW